MCVQNLDDSQSFAVRITYRISLRSSSLWEPRHPPLKVVMDLVVWGEAQGLASRAAPFQFQLWFHFWLGMKDREPLGQPATPYFFCCSWSVGLGPQIHEEGDLGSVW